MDTKTDMRMVHYNFLGGAQQECVGPMAAKSFLHHVCPDGSQLRLFGGFELGPLRVFGSITRI